METSHNPYQTPEGQLTDDSQAYGEIRFFSPSTRIGRLRYLAHSFLLTLAGVAILALGAGLAAAVSEIFWVLFGLGYLAMIVLSVILLIQRLHDLNKSGWMVLLMLVPLVSLGLVIYVVFFSGTPGRNNFGLKPPPNQTWHWILGLAGPIVGALAIIGILIAVAIPAYQDFAEHAQGVDSSSEYESYDEVEVQDDAGQYDDAAEPSGDTDQYNSGQYDSDQYDSEEYEEEGDDAEDYNYSDDEQAD